MTAEEIERERETARVALRDRAHRYHGGATVFIEAYEIADEKTREFMRTIAPYMFEPDGTAPLREGADG
jgi:hypothetical protein